MVGYRGCEVTSPITICLPTGRGLQPFTSALMASLAVRTKDCLSLLASVELNFDTPSRPAPKGKSVHLVSSTMSSTGVTWLSSRPTCWWAAAPCPGRPSPCPEWWVSGWVSRAEQHTRGHAASLDDDDKVHLRQNLLCGERRRLAGPALEFDILTASRRGHSCTRAAFACGLCAPQKYIWGSRQQSLAGDCVDPAGAPEQ